MTFLQPWAWIGLVAVAAPIVAHLLARRAARRQPFPTVRFLPAAIQTPISRHRLTDILLLVVRCFILIAAAAALAQPIWLTADQRRALGDSVARAIIVDSAAADAEPLVERLSADSTLARVARADAPAALIGEAATWLAQQPMRRELVLVSDFPAGTISKADLDRIPAEIGIKLVPATRSAHAGAAIELRDGPVLLTSAADRASALAARDAVIAQGGPAGVRNDRPIALVFPGHEGRDALLKPAREIDQPWMFDVLLAIDEDRLVTAAALDAGRTVADMVQPLAAPIDGDTHLLLVMSVPPASLASASVIRAAARAMAPPQAFDVTVTHPAKELTAWERPPAAVAPDGSRIPEESRGRWLWLAALILMVIERVMVQRGRRPRTDAHTEVRDVARVA